MTRSDRSRIAALKVHFSQKATNAAAAKTKRRTACARLALRPWQTLMSIRTKYPARAAWVDATVPIKKLAEGDRIARAIATTHQKKHGALRGRLGMDTALMDQLPPAAGRKGRLWNTHLSKRPNARFKLRI